MRLFARTLRRLWARPLKASYGHGMDAFTEGGATRTRPLISCQRLCACALLLLIVPAILATSSSTSSFTSSCSSYRSRLSALGYANEPMFNLWLQQQQQQILPTSIALTFAEGHNFKRACSALSILSSLSLLFLSLSCAFAVVFYITARFWIATRAVAFSTYLKRSSHRELRSV